MKRRFNLIAGLVIFVLTAAMPAFAAQRTVAPTQVKRLMRKPTVQKGSPVRSDEVSREAVKDVVRPAVKQELSIEAKPLEAVPVMPPKPQVSCVRVGGFTSVSNVRFSPDGSTVAFSEGGQGGVVKVYNRATGTTYDLIPPQTRSVANYAIENDELMVLNRPLDSVTYFPPTQHFAATEITLFATQDQGYPDITLNEFSNDLGWIAYLRGTAIFERNIGLLKEVPQVPISAPLLQDLALVFPNTSLEVLDIAWVQDAGNAFNSDIIILARTNELQQILRLEIPVNPMTIHATSGEIISLDVSRDGQLVAFLTDHMGGQPLAKPSVFLWDENVDIFYQTGLTASDNGKVFIGGNKILVYDKELVQLDIAGSIIIYDRGTKNSLDLLDNIGSHPYGVLGAAMSKDGSVVAYIRATSIDICELPASW